MKRFSILFRVVLLSAVLLVVLVGSDLYLGRQISDDRAIMLEQAELLATVTTAQAASTAFGELKYWLTDLAVSLLMQSERKAEEARTALTKALDQLAPQDPKTTAEIRSHIGTLMEQAFLAVDAYSNNERVLGNSLMAESRVHFRHGEKGISRLVRRLENEALKKRAAALKKLESTKNLSISVMILVSLLGLP